jgi:ligand-binding sensor domain-containing protein
MADLRKTAWGAMDGAPGGGVTMMAQSADGFRWLASSGYGGLYRFDGRRFELIELPRSAHSKTPLVYSLFVPRTGGVWIGLTFGGAAFFKDGRLSEYTEKDGLPPGSVKDFAEDQDGVIWAATTHGLARLVSDHWEVFAHLDAIGVDPGAMIFDTEGTLWLSCFERLLFRPKGATVLEEIRGDFHAIVPGVAESGSGTIWIAENEGIRSIKQIENPSGRAVNSAAAGLLVDREGSIWINDNSQIQRIRQPPGFRESELIGLKDPRRADLFGSKDGLRINKMLEDREGDIWVSNNRGLDRFSEQNLTRAFQVPAIETSIGFADDGSLWVAPRLEKDPIWRFENGKLVPRTLPLDTTVSSLLRAHDGSLWFGSRSGLLHYSRDELREDARLLKWSERIALPPSALQSDIQALAEDQSGAIWISVVRKGLFKVVDGHWVKNGGLTGLPNLYPITVSADSKGRIWLGYAGYAEDQIAVVDGIGVHFYSEADGLNIGNVTSIYAQRSTIWVGGDDGVAFFDGERFRSVRSETIRLEGITGIVET